MFSSLRMFYSLVSPPQGYLISRLHLWPYIRPNYVMGYSISRLVMTRLEYPHVSGLVHIPSWAFEMSKVLKSTFAVESVFQKVTSFHKVLFRKRNHWVSQPYYNDQFAHCLSVDWVLFSWKRTIPNDSLVTFPITLYTFTSSCPSALPSSISHITCISLS